MSQQGERCGHEDDWWRELYDADKADTGPGPAADSLDDRFYSAARTLDTTRTDPPARRRPDAPPGRRDTGGGRVESGRAESGRAESSRLESGRVHPGRPDPGRPDPGRIESCRAEPRHPGPDLPQRAAEEGEWWQSTPPALGRDRADSPPVAWPEPTWPEPAWPAPPRLSRPPKPRPPYEDSAGYAAAYAVDPHGRPGASAPDDFASDAVPLRESDDFASGLVPFRDPDDLAADAAPLRELADFPAPAVDAASLRDPDARPPAEAEFVGERPPTYEGEPTALPLVDPDGIGDLVPDTVLDGARYGSFALRTASLRGDSPRYRGEPRHDALVTVRFGTGEGALVAVVVAGGVRSVAGAHRPAADLGRWIAAAVGRSHDRLAEDIREGRRGDLIAGLHRLTDRGYGRLRARAAELGLEQDEYTATLRCLLLPADPGCRTRVSFGVGDGGLFQLRRGRWQDLEEPADGEPVGTDEALTVGEHPFRFRATAARRGDTLLLCGAGLAEPLRDEPDLAGLLAERWAPAEPPGLAAFLADVQLRAKGYADDRTAAAVWEV